MSGEKWDWIQCEIVYDGHVNAEANTRYWYISDRYSTDNDYPWKVGVDGISEDAEQDWVYLGDGTLNYTECDNWARCTFVCSASRNYQTDN